MIAFKLLKRSYCDLSYQKDLTIYYVGEVIKKTLRSITLVKSACVI